LDEQEVEDGEWAILFFFSLFPFFRGDQHEVSDLGALVPREWSFVLLVLRE